MSRDTDDQGRKPELGSRRRRAAEPMEAYGMEALNRRRLSRHDIGSDRRGALAYVTVIIECEPCLRAGEHIEMSRFRLRNFGDEPARPEGPLFSDRLGHVAQDPDDGHSKLHLGPCRRCGHNPQIREDRLNVAAAAVMADIPRDTQATKRFPL